MFKKTACLSVCTLMTLAAGSSSAWAAGESSTVINIKAEIPSTTFHVGPVNPDFGKDESMAYNPVSKSLSSLNQVYNIKSTTGSIHAYIDGGPTALYNGNSSQNIALTTTFNGVELTATPKAVAAASQEIVAGTQANLNISPAKPATDSSGLFTASYTLVFDHVAP